MQSIVYSTEYHPRNTFLICQKSCWFLFPRVTNINSMVFNVDMSTVSIAIYRNAFLTLYTNLLSKLGSKKIVKIVFSFI